jgi:signal transduction histidine kinase
MPGQPRPSARIVAEPRWDVYYAVVLAACLAIVDAAPVHVSQRIIATAALAAMVPWYLFLGRPLMMQDQPATRKATVYLAGLVVLFAVAQSQVANAWVLAFGLVPMCFHVTTARRALAFVVIINVIGAGLDAWRNPGLAGALTALGIAAFAIAFAYVYVYSRWMARVIAQSLDRAALIEQLEATRAELAAAHHEAGVQAERHRLAGEIHDTLAQGFTSIVTLLQAGQASLDAASPARRHLDLALLTARENLAEARTLVTALTPATLEAGTLGDTVRRVTSATGAQAGIEADAEVTGTARRLPTGTEVVLLRVCQEALANVRKHADARQVRVRLCYAGATVRLTVTDDGKGFDPGGATGGYGLKGMRDRVSQVGGTVEVASVPGRGTEVSAEVPG